MTQPFPTCPSPLPQDTSDHLTELGRAWRNSTARPTAAPGVLHAWDELIKAWLDDQSLPLLVRRGGLRGSEVSHSTGRGLVITDNSPAQWACQLAIRGIVPSVQDIHNWIKADAIPVALALSAEERKTALFKCPLGKFSVNIYGWKACHCEPVGLNSAKPLEQMDIGIIRQHFVRLVSPSNHFLVPKEWGGLGELPEFIQAMKSK